ncbi:MAG: reverse transcriptase/maturase family protein [Candidatus Omnitrophica bacterium]|nr:reverse transcriptase/maturase family protein [Candidatus Omnitrophota bacterium]
MKTIKNIYNKIVSKENLYHSAYLASKGRRYNDSVADFNFNREKEINSLHKELSKKTYRHRRYRLFTIYEPKKRNIAAAPFRDRVVHHAVHDAIEPFIDKGFIYHSYACRKDKGTHKAVDKAQSFLRANKYCLHGDIRKYFPSIDHKILKGFIAKRIKDGDVFWLLEKIVDSAQQLTAGKAVGLPIGNLTSQLFANLYLDKLDYFMKFNLKHHYYLRYMDDFLVFGNDKRTIQNIKNEIREFLQNKLNLILHEGKSQIYNTDKGVKFLGFKLFNRYRRLSSDNLQRFKKKLKKSINSLKPGCYQEVEKFRASLRCWTAHARYANTVGLRRAMVKKLEISNDFLEKVVKEELYTKIGTNSCLQVASYRQHVACSLKLDARLKWKDSDGRKN